MEKEVFTITVHGQDYMIITSLPIGPDPVNHEVWKDGNLLFVINPQLNQFDQPAWALTAEYADQNIDKALVQKIGEAIERHYL